MLENFKSYFDTSSSGVYALFLNDNGDISIFNEVVQSQIKNKMTNNLLYIGKASNLKKRINNCHLKKARISTLRRTIAKLLEMDFIVVSNNKGLSEENEKIITNWLIKNTYFKILETPDEKSAVQLEDELIEKYQPPFNKDGCTEHF